MKDNELSQWSGILVYLECCKGHIHKAGIELIGEAYRLAKQLGTSVYTLGIGENMEQVQEELKGYPVKQAYLYETEDEYTPLWYEKIAVECIQGLKPAIVLIGGTLEGRALAPRLAVAFQTGLTADCTSLAIASDGGLIQTRPAFDGKHRDTKAQAAVCNRKAGRCKGSFKRAFCKYRIYPKYSEKYR